MKHIDIEFRVLSCLWKSVWVFFHVFLAGGNDVGKIDRRKKHTLTHNTQHYYKNITITLILPGRNDVRKQIGGGNIIQHIIYNTITGIQQWHLL